MQMRRKIENKLLELGITPNLKGFGYMADAVEYIMSNNGCFMKDVYIQVAAINKLNGYSNTERAMRHAISKADEEKWKAIGGQGVKNSEFLFTLALLLKEEFENE